MKREVLTPRTKERIHFLRGINEQIKARNEFVIPTVNHQPPGTNWRKERRNNWTEEGPLPVVSRWRDKDGSQSCEQMKLKIRQYSSFDT